VVGLFVAGYERWRSMAEADAARSRVQVGMTPAEAEPQMGGAWRHIQCQDGQSAVHLYLFGSDSLDQTGIVLLHREREQSREVMTFVDSEENSRISLHERCSASG